MLSKNQDIHLKRLQQHHLENILTLFLAQLQFLLGPLYYETINNISPPFTGRGFGFLKSLLGGTSKIWAGLNDGTPVELTKKSDIDSAVRIIYGSYVGNGDKWGGTRTITFDSITAAYFAVVYHLDEVSRSEPYFMASDLSYWIPAGLVNVSYRGILTNSSFEVGEDSYGNVGLNAGGNTYNYIIFGV